MLADIPKAVKNGSSSVLSDIKKGARDYIDGIKEFGGRVPKKIGEVSSGYIDDIKELSQARLFYDGCNAGIILPNGKVNVYRNKYCSTPSVTAPSDIEGRLRELDLDECGEIRFVAVYCTKVLGEYWQNNSTQLIRVKASLSDAYAAYKKAYPDGSDIKFFPYINGQSGWGQSVQISTGISYFIGHLGGGNFNTNGRETNPPFGYLEYPYYSMVTYGVSITGSTSKHAVNAILDYLGTGGYSPEIFSIEVSDKENSACPLRTISPPPPPPPKDKECECMCCDDSLLKLVLKRIGSLPAKVPDNFTKQQPTMVDIESLAELMLWQMQQLDALMGAYPIEIEIEDSDLTKEGNQKEKISVPNQAEAIAELLGLLLTVKRDTHATLITAVKAMAEAGMAKNLGTKTLDVALANAEFLGYKLEQKKKEIPSLFTPNGKNLTETLQEKNVEIITYENTDKKDLQDDLKKLLEMAARWNAQNWRRVTGDPVESLKQMLFGNVDAVKETGIKAEQDDFDSFTERAERGFTDIDGITDVDNPWGKPFNQRPKIREIGTEQGRYDADGKEIPKV